MSFYYAAPRSAPAPAGSCALPTRAVCGCTSARGREPYSCGRDHSDTAPIGGGRGGGPDWSPFLELGQAPGARVCARYGYLSLVPLRLAPYYCCYDPGVGHHAHPAALQAGLRPTLRLPLPVLVKQRLIGLPKPTTSRVVSEARCAQRRCLTPWRV